MTPIHDVLADAIADGQDPKLVLARTIEVCVVELCRLEDPGVVSQILEQIVAGVRNASARVHPSGGVVN